MEKLRADAIVERILFLLKEKDYKAIRQELTSLYPVDIAALFDELDDEGCVLLFRLLHKDQAADVFSYLNKEQRREIVAAIHQNLLTHILGELYFDDKIDFLEELPANFVKRLIAAAPQQERALINQFLNYPENSAGSLMTIEYVDLKAHHTVRQALARIRQTGMDKETIYTCYVLDDTRRLIGLISLRKLVLAQEDLCIGDIMDKEVVLLQTDDDQEYAADLFKKYDLMAIPVVDGEHRLTGIITIDDILDVIEQENTEDFQKMAAMQPSDEAYLNTPVVRLARRRVVWLLVLMVSATFTGGIIAKYESLLSSAVLLATFIPMLMDSGGNAGSQSSTLIIRGLALGDITLRDWPRVLFKELRVGLLAGGALSLVNFVRMCIFKSGDARVMLTVSVTLLFTVLIAKLIGGTLPIAAKALKLDPAIMAGPLITTIVDALSLLIFFSVASGLMPG